MSQSWAADVKNSKFYGRKKRNSESGVHSPSTPENQPENAEELSYGHINVEGISAISDFYKDRSVFVTGATGFVGKVLLEKLLRSCNGIKTIYVLMRGKDGQDPRPRLDAMMSLQIFDRVRKDQTKVVPINGDITQSGLGISPSDMSLITKNASVVFHCAATVRFDEPFRVSVDINILGTRRVVELCHKMSKLAALVHVSTAYAFCDREEIDEVVYPEPVLPQKIIDVAEWMGENLLATVVPQLLSGRPSNYHYTKAVAENLVVQEAGNLPVAIVRPSIVSGAWREPVPGWVDNYNGPNGFIVATGKGVLRTMVVYSHIAADMIPVDIVSNMLIAVAWNIGVNRPSNPLVFNCTSCAFNRMTWGDIHRISYPALVQYPSMEIFRYPGGSFKTNKYYNAYCVAVQHYLPAYLVDFLAKVTGQKQGMVALYDRIHRALGFLEYFTTKEWTFRSDNVIALMGVMQGEDGNRFNVDIRKINWDNYVTNYVKGVRKYLLKEDEATLPAARNKLRMIYWLSTLLQMGTLIASIRFAYKRFRTVRRFWWRFVFFILEKLQGPLSLIL